MDDDYLGLRLCFAGLNALVPRVIKVGVASTSAVSEPRTAATATTQLPGFPDSGASGAHGTNGRRRDYWCACVGVGQDIKD